MLLVTVRNTAGEDVAILDMTMTSTILQVKTRIAEQNNPPPDRLQLLHGHSLLADDQTLAELVLPIELTLVRLQWKYHERTYRKGDLVELHYNGNTVYDALQDAVLPWTDKMNDMLGRTFVVQNVPEPGYVALPSPDASSNDPLVIFPDSLVRDGQALKVGDVVRLTDDEEVLWLAFKTGSFVRQMGSCECHIAFRWGGCFTRMLGREFPVIEMPCQSLVLLPWQYDGEQVKVPFPVSVVTKINSEQEFIIRQLSR